MFLRLRTYQPRGVRCRALVSWLGSWPHPPPRRGYQDEGRAASTVACAERPCKVYSQTGIPDLVRTMRRRLLPDVPSIRTFRSVSHVRRYMGYPPWGLEGGNLISTVRQVPSLPEFSVYQQRDDTAEEEEEERC